MSPSDLSLSDFQALNYISQADVVAAASGVRQGRTVSLAAPVESYAGPDNPEPCLHQMTSSAGRDEPGLSFAMDRVAMNIHGSADSHIDALCHVLYDGFLYNDIPAQAVTATGATGLSIDVAGHGIAGYGRLLDIPRLRGVRSTHWACICWITWTWKISRRRVHACAGGRSCA